MICWHLYQKNMFSNIWRISILLTCAALSATNHCCTHTRTLIVPSALASDVCSLLVLSRFSRASSCAFCSSLLSLDSERCSAASWAWNSLRSSTFTWEENQRCQHTKYEHKTMFGTSQSALTKVLINPWDGICPPPDGRYISLSSLWRSKRS